MSHQNPERIIEGGNSHSATEKLRQGTENVLHQAEDMIGKARQEIKKQSLDAQHAVVEYIKENPVKSMGISMLLGATIALLLRR